MYGVIDCVTQDNRVGPRSGRSPACEWGEISRRKEEKR
jgi:hypothetical protein